MQVSADAGLKGAQFASRHVGTQSYTKVFGSSNVCSLIPILGVSERFRLTTGWLPPNTSFALIRTGKDIVTSSVFELAG